MNVKHWRIGLALVLTPALLSAQTDSLPPYLQQRRLPHFTLQLTDGSSILRRDDLDSSRPVLIMLFSPNCDHCHRQTTEITRRMADLGDLQIVLCTYEALDMIKSFQETFRLKEFPAIRVGRDAGFFFVPFFAARNVPLLALYDRRQQLLEVFRGTVPVDKILGALGMSQTTGY